MKMYCENQVIYIASNFVFHELTKNIEFDCHFINNAMISKKMTTPYVKFDVQLGFDKSSWEETILYYLF